jgi:asparagine synthase (glutamine-hydrolysing)
MCGLVGLLNSRLANDETERVVRTMARKLAHRGPDGEGFWFDHECRVAFGHRRLAVVDLSPAGAQPMISSSGRNVFIFNGEIYNHAELRRRLDCAAPRPWRGHCDAEVLLEAIDAWGLETALKAVNGQFAIAVWDKDAGLLSLARDRAGEKPLYYARVGETLAFGSELKALVGFPGLSLDLDHTALGLFFAENCVPAPRTIYRDVFKVEAGSIVAFELDCGDRLRQRSERAYWRVRSALERPTFRGDAAEAVAEVERRLEAAVRLQMVADVPVGAFLSGGVDSTLTASMMQACASRRIKTFSVGFEDPEFDESSRAAEAAQLIGSDHTPFVVTAEMALGLIPKLADMYDEPFADSSQIPTALLAALTRRSVTVALSGDGGDELFGGYPRYVESRMLFRLPARRLLAKALRRANLGLVAKVARRVPGRLAARVTEKRLGALAPVLEAGTASDCYSAYFYQPDRAGELLKAPSDISRELGRSAFGGPRYLAAVSAADFENYLGEEVLTKVDRAAMAASLETRAPFLDVGMIEFAFTLPDEVKVRNGVLKWPLRALLKRRLPQLADWQTKMGFSVPLAAWLRGPVKPWAEEVLHDPSPLLDQDAVLQLWREHQAGGFDWSTRLWRVLMFKAWSRGPGAGLAT